MHIITRTNSVNIHLQLEEVFSVTLGLSGLTIHLNQNLLPFTCREKGRIIKLQGFCIFFLQCFHCKKKICRKNILNLIKLISFSHI